ncbi:hypothetical protein PAHA111176_03470 [Parendozoicomonas haliclonae]|uniref:Uncharacterized protein n=1 Tax=Parendozoicomonas haliclonae TaxID=1960125 RepID=A0A1X7AJP0_9GAMM|nr:hypothetical protein EHSB41UT_02057 [Parendozoicomonas haliclonae]
MSEILTQSQFIRSHKNKQSVTGVAVGLAAINQAQTCLPEAADLTGCQNACRQALKLTYFLQKD